MNPKIVLTGTGIVDLLIGIAFFFGKEAILTSAFSGIGEEGLAVGSIFLEVMASLYVCMAIILILSRDIEIPGAKKVVLGAGLGHFVIFALMIFHTTKVPEGGDGGPPIPLMVIHAAIVIWALFVAYKAESTDDDYDDPRVAHPSD